VFSNAIGYGIDQHVLRRIPIRRFSVLLALLPVTAALELVEPLVVADLAEQVGQAVVAP
jgi:threonine/homoserine efflux transporter RhtA